MAARTSLRDFLGAARQALATAANTPEGLTFVVGNESADLDSVCSAVLLAYWRTTSRRRQEGSTFLHIPLANLPRVDLALRPELDALLSRAGVAANDLATLSDLPEALAPSRTRWLLVDHNAPTGSLVARGFANRVTGCVDHHADEGFVAPDADPRVVETAAGSCASLVVDMCRSDWEHAEPNEAVDADLACVALAPILADTACLLSPTRTRDLDVRAAEFVERFLVSADAGYDRTTFYDAVTRLKGDLSGLSVRDMLHRDYKQWAEAGGVNLGISAIARHLDEVLAAAAGPTPFLHELRAWAAERDLGVVAVMTASGTDQGVGFTRQLLVWAVTPEAVVAARLFAHKNRAVLGLETWGKGSLDEQDDKGSHWRRCWIQREVTNSRKQIAPMLRDAIKEAERGVTLP